MPIYKVEMLRVLDRDNYETHLQADDQRQLAERLLEEIETMCPNHEGVLDVGVSEDGTLMLYVDDEPTGGFGLWTAS